VSEPFCRGDTATHEVKAGDVFFIDPDDGTNPHYWIVLSVYSPDLSYENFAIIVNITSMKKGADMTCVLRPSDLDAPGFLTHESYAYFGECRDVEVAKLQARSAERRTPVPSALLSRLRAGLHKSPHTRRKIKPKVPRP